MSDCSSNAFKTPSMVMESDEYKKALIEGFEEGLKDGMTDEYKSFLKSVNGGEGDRCLYNTRLDTYGKGCGHDCEYCYAKSLLSFRGLWNPSDPSVADIDKIRRAISNKLNAGDIVRLGGMTDCFQEAEMKYRVTYETIKALNDKGVGYLIVTKSPLVAHDEYVDILDKDLAHIQVSITHTGEAPFERKAAPYAARKWAVERLQGLGYDVQVRLSPYIQEFVNLGEIADIGCDKVLVEFLRANHFIRKSLDIDYSPYTHREGNYSHLPLEKKLELLDKISGFSEVSVCDDVQEHYEYFRDNVNNNPNDCCNLRR